MSMLSSILNVVTAAAEQFVPGIAKYENAVTATLDFVKAVRPTLESQDQESLDAALAGKLAKMNRDADATIAYLRGTGS